MKDPLKRNSVVTTALVPLAATLGMLIASSDAVAQVSKSYQGITQQMFDGCIKPKAINKTDRGWAEYEGDNTGKVEIKTDSFAHELASWLGISAKKGLVAKLNFDYKPEEKMLIYSRTWLDTGVKDEDLWKGFDGTMRKCKG